MLLACEEPSLSLLHWSNAFEPTRWQKGEETVAGMAGIIKYSLGFFLTALIPLKPLYRLSLCRVSIGTMDLDPEASQLHSLL